MRFKKGGAMKTYLIKAMVDEECVKNASGEDDLENAIRAEAGWMHDSGIFVESIEEVKD